MESPAIEVRSFHKSYRLGLENFLRVHHAVKGIDFTVPKGAIFGFVGPNGAGKTTTIKSLVGLLRPTKGEIRVWGGNPFDASVRKRLGFMPEQPYFYDHLSGSELLNYFGHLSGLSGAPLQEAIERACELCKIRKDWLSRRLRTYSKGMGQRVGLAQAILHRPDLLILDEPMSGLDPMGRRDVKNILRTLHEEGSTLFYSSHVLADVEEICTHAAMIVAGTVRRAGDLREILSGPNGTTLRLEDILATEVGEEYTDA
jgi:ABC-2 type transport system ATP-binding protein